MNNVPVNELAHMYILCLAQSKQQLVNAMGKDVPSIQSPEFCGIDDIERVFQLSCHRLKSDCKTRCQMHEQGLFDLLIELARMDVVDLLNACWAWDLFKYDEQGLLCYVHGVTPNDDRPAVDNGVDPQGVLQPLRAFDSETGQMVNFVKGTKKSGNILSPSEWVV